MTKHIVLLQALASMPQDLTKLLKDVDEKIIYQRPAPGQWAITEVVSHLIHVERRYLKRLKRVVEEERPMLPLIMPGDSAHNSRALVCELLTHLESARTKTINYLKGLSPAEWQRPAVHKTKGETNLYTLVQRLVNHDAQHLNQLIEIQAQLRAFPTKDPQPAISPQS